MWCQYGMGDGSVTLYGQGLSTRASVQTAHGMVLLPCMNKD